MFRNFWRKVVNFFTGKSENTQTTPVQLPTPDETPVELPEIKEPEGEISGPVYGFKPMSFADFSNLWSKTHIDPDRKDAASKWAMTIIRNRSRYEYVSQALGGKIPWFFIGALHYRESGCDFAGVLHNGQRILGTGKKTTWVPKGRGPFNTWEESAIDALKLKNYQNETDWTIGACLYRSERFNGTGYHSRIGDHGKIELTPYVFAGSNLHDKTSKYVEDGKYDPVAREKQLGVATIYKALGV